MENVSAVKSNDGATELFKTTDCCTGAAAIGSITGIPSHIIKQNFSAISIAMLCHSRRFLVGTGSRCAEAESVHEKRKIALHCFRLSCLSPTLLHRVFFYCFPYTAYGASESSSVRWMWSELHCAKFLHRNIFQPPVPCSK